LKARESLKAIPGVIEPRSFTILDAVFRDTPRILAKSVMEIDWGIKWWFFRIRPGGTGGLLRSLIMSPLFPFAESMVIFTIYFIGMAVFENKGNSPISGYLNSPSSLLFR